MLVRLFKRVASGSDVSVCPEDETYAGDAFAFAAGTEVGFSDIGFSVLTVVERCDMSSCCFLKPSSVFCLQVTLS